MIRVWRSAILLIAIAGSIALLLYRLRPDSTPVSSLVSLPRALHSKYPGFNSYNPRYMWWHQDNSLQVLHKKEDSWRQLFQLKQVAANWAEPVSIAHNSENFYIAIRRETNLQLLKGVSHGSMDENRPTGRKMTWKEMSHVPDWFHKAEFPLLGFLNNRLLVFAIVSDGESSSLRMSMQVAGGFESVTLDKEVCECCRLSASYLSDGTVVLSYRDKLADENRPIKVLKIASSSEITELPLDSPPWRTSACPVNGPSLSVNSQDEIALTWFTRLGEESQAQPTVMYSVSRPKLEQRFDPPLVLDTGSHVIGRTSTTTIEDDFITFWYSSRPGSKNGQLNGKLIERDEQEQSFATRVISGIDPGLDSGFPISIATGQDRIQLFWTANKRKQVLGKEFNRAFFAQEKTVKKSESIPSDATYSELLTQEFTPINGLSTETSVPILDPDKPFTLISFWATWCGPCIQEIPYYNGFAQKFPKIALRTILLDDPPALAEFLERYSVEFDVFKDGAEELGTFYQINSLPTAILFDRKGKIYWRHSGNDTRALSGLINKTAKLP